MGRYFDDEDPSGKQAIFNNLRSNIQSIGSVAIQKQLQDQQRKQALQDIVKKAIIESQMKGKRIKPDADMSKVMTGEGMLDTSQFEEYNPLSSILGGVKPQGQGTGQVLGGGMKLKGITSDEEGNLKYNIETLPTEQEKQDEIRQAAAKTAAIEEAKPYSAEEIKIVSGQSLIPQIDKLINLAETNKVYEGGGVPFGASRISAFGEKGPWQSFKRGLTAGKGREAGLILQDIKQIMFSVGGQALTDPEILKLGPKMEPAYKTEEQWISDLKDVKTRIQEKAALMRPNPNKVFAGQSYQAKTNQYQVGQTISKGGKNYQITGFDTDGEPLVDLVR